MPQKSKLIVLRFSAMGDVAMVASVLTEFSARFPDVEIVMVSRPAFRAFFTDIPQLSFHAIEPKGKHRGIGGLFRLYRELAAYKVSAVADLHDSLRSRFLSLLFRFRGVKIWRIDKGRAEKRTLTRAENKILEPLKPTVERYADVFRSLGYDFSLSHQLLRRKKALPELFEPLFADNKQARIGISPFAQHAPKMYDLAKMEIVIEALNKSGIRLFIFGGGAAEQEIARGWEQKYAMVYNVIGKCSLEDELALISNLDLMLSMDSSGMHLASLMGLRVVSLWGATHPYAGFLGYGQHLEDCLQTDHPLRPNSVYGNKPCMTEEGVSCIDLISPEQIIKKLIRIVVVPKRLILIRHGDAELNFALYRDFDRPLSRRGESDVQLMAGRIAKHITPELLVCSPALRTRSTARYFAEAWGIPDEAIQYNESIYEARVSALWNIIRKLDNRYHTVALIGHNPALTDLVNSLAGTEIDDMPTCGVAVLSIYDNGWETLSDMTTVVLFK